MQPKCHFRFKRFQRLIRNDLFVQYRTLLIAGGAILGILIFINFLSLLGNSRVTAPAGFYPLLLFAGGYIISSMAFTDLHHPQKSYLYLTLPCSNTEKFLSRLVLTSVGYGLATLILYFLFSAIISLLSLLLTGYASPLFDPFEREIFISLGVYLVTQSLFLLGAVYFRRHAFIKTVLSLFGLLLVLALFTLLILRLSFWNDWVNLRDDPRGLFISSELTKASLESFFIALGQTLKYLFWTVLAPFFWIVTFLRLKETEA